MSSRIISTKYYLVALVLVVAIATIFYFCFKSFHEDTNRKIYEYTASFYTNHTDKEVITPTQTQILKDAASHIGNDSVLYRDMEKFAIIMFEQGDQVAAFKYLSHIMSILDSSHNPSEMLLKYKACCYLLLGASTDEMGMISLSQEYYFAGMRVADQIDNPSIKNDFYNNLGVSIYKSGNVEKAYYFYKQALRGADADGNNLLKSIILNNIAEIYADKGDISMAIDYMLKAIHTVDASANPEDYYSMYSMLGSLYSKHGDYPLAYAYLTNAYRHQTLLGNKSFLFDTMMLLADYFNQLSQPDSTNKYMREAWRIAELTKNPEQGMMLLDRESEIAAASGNHKEAYKLAKRSGEMKDSLQKTQNSYMTESANNIYELERKAYQEMTGISKWNPVVVFMIMSLILLMLLAVVVWIIIVKRKTDRINEKTIRVTSELSEMKDRQLSAEKERKEKQEEELRLFNQKLTSFTLDRIKTDEQIEEIAMDIKKALLNVPSRNSDLQMLLKDSIRKITLLQSDTQWDEFQYYFDRVHPDFYSRLDARHPNLTLKDRRLCALISLGLSTKDIASVIRIEVRSVESSRNRLRRKLNLECEQNLFDYIRTLNEDNS